MKRLFLTLMIAASGMLAFAQNPAQDSTHHGHRHHHDGPEAQHHGHGGPDGQHHGGPDGQDGPRKNPFFMDRVFKTFMVKGYAQGGFTYMDKDPQKHQVIPNLMPSPDPNAPAGTMIPAGPPTIIDKSTNTFDMKRAYIFAQATLTDHFKFWIMYDFCGVFNEYYLEYNAFKNGALNFRLGQQKHPFGLENPYSPTKMELIDVYSQATTYLAGCGSDPLYGVQYGRDLGLVMLGDLGNPMGKHLHYEMGVLNGQGVNSNDRNNKKDFSGRLEFFPDAKFKVVVSGQTGWGNVESNSRTMNGAMPYTVPAIGQKSTLQPGMDYKRQRWGFGAEYRTHAMSGPAACDYWTTRPTVLRAEILGGKDDVYKSLGYYVAGAVPMFGKFDAVASYDFMNYNTDLDIKQTNYVVGLQYWCYKGCRIQLQYTYCDTELMGGYSKLQIQTQVAF